MYLIVILYALFASTFTMGKILLTCSQPFFITGMRMLIAGGIILAYQYFYRHDKFLLRRQDILLYAQAMLFSIILPYNFRFWGLRYMPSSKATLLYNLGPFISFIIAYLLGTERISWRKGAGLAIGFSGLLITLIAKAPAEESFGGIGFLSGPEIAMILSVTSMAYGWVIMRRMLKEHHYCPLMINGVSMFGGGLFSLIASFIFENKPLFTNPLTFFPTLGIIVLVSNLICHNLYTSLLKKYSPTLLSFAGFLCPIFAAFYGWALMGEVIPWHFWISIIIIVTGLTIFYQDELKEWNQE